ncbi:hypothetical protein [Roseofilum casamattae]|uniref:Uncharacterized protein n=1 Tax=Roseofilum casamattae BLCC-M143 TaxID=3022442 RepID=A0ABT7BYJ5_9CYAN|nr:hypothetical protein [Roseofilum casamattae]MDJ1184274.1 hypothetical protein [Roseofilum casamattae BLCC-M143]
MKPTLKQPLSLLVFGSLSTFALLYGCASLSQPQPSQEMLMDVATNLVTQKFVNSSCEDLAQMKSTNPAEASGPQAKLQEKAVEMLRNNPQVREEFINRVAPQIANRMFECELIP